MARRKPSLAELPATTAGRLRCWLKRVEWAWKSLLLVAAIFLAGLGAAEWKSSSMRAIESSIREMQLEMARVKSAQDEMRGDLKLIKRKLIGDDLSVPTPW